MSNRNMTILLRNIERCFCR